MAKTNLKLYSTDDLGQDITTTINYANPEASKNDILAFTQNLNNLTTNIYKETEKITTVNVDSEPIPSTPTLTASKTQYSASEFTTSMGFSVATTFTELTYNGDGGFFIARDALDAGMCLETSVDNGVVTIRLRYMTAKPPTFPCTFNVGFTETNNYKAASVEITITA